MLSKKHVAARPAATACNAKLVARKTRLVFRVIVLSLSPSRAGNTLAHVHDTPGNRVRVSLSFSRCGCVLEISRLPRARNILKYFGR